MLTVVTFVSDRFNNPISKSTNIQTKIQNQYPKNQKIQVPLNQDPSPKKPKNPNPKKN